MKKFVTCLLMLLLTNSVIWAQQVTIVKWSAIQRVLTQQSDTTFIINFWATWCKPCVTELPYFEEIHKKYETKNVKILLISMDFAGDVTTRVIPFVTQRKLMSKVWVLNEPDANSWIDKVSSTWSGAIPATLIFNNFKKKRAFFEQKLAYDQLVKEVNNFL